MNNEEDNLIYENGFVFTDKEEQRQFYNRMWYYKTYNQLIDKGLQREINGELDQKGYYEKHHILPKCMGGNNEKSNYVKLTAREHIMAHLLLAEIYPDNLSLSSAAVLLSSIKKNNKYVISSSTRIVSELRSNYGKLQKGKVVSSETKKKMSKSRLGHKTTEETKEKISLREKGKVVSEETRKILSKNNRSGEDSMKEKFSKISSERFKNKENRDIISSTLKNKDYIHGSRKILRISDNFIFNTIQEACIFYNISRTTLTKWIKRGDKDVKYVDDLITNIKLQAKKVIGPDGTVYNSINDCHNKTGYAKLTIKRWIKDYPEKGFKYLN